MHRFTLFVRVAALGLMCSASALPAQEGAGAVELSLDSLLNTRISAASKYDQRAAEAPASVTIVTSDDIAQFGYRTIDEALENVRGFYLSDDHNYPYLGTRGFSRPTDYNNRILVLIDGHTLNEAVWGGVQIGSNLPINLDAVERIEIVRGPGSVLYGTNAMFAVINIVTKDGAELDGLRVNANVGSMGLREIGLAGGHLLGTNGSVTASALASRADGRDFYFNEFDDPTTSNGRASGLDWEERLSGLASVEWGGLTTRVGTIWRAKGVPTGAFATLFGDERFETTDYNVWGEVGYRKSFRNAYQFTSRAFADWYGYEGAYPYIPDATYLDDAANGTVGGEAMLIWDASSRNRLTIGTEYRRVLRASYRETWEDGSVTEDDAPTHAISLFAQDEFHVLPRLTAVTGLRLDRQQGFDVAYSPRVALIATPDRRTTIKALYGEAFRAPSAAEARITTTYYHENADLEAEEIRTVELSIQRRLAQPLLIGVSAYEYRITGLIDPVLAEGEETMQFRNIAASQGRGVEVELDVVGQGPLSARATFAWLNTRDLQTDESLSNSPNRIGTVSLMARLSERLRSAVLVRHESERLTLAGSPTPSFFRTDLNVGYAMPVSSRTARGLDVSVRVRNLFAKRYFTPGGVEHTQAAIEQDGRSVSLRFDWRY